jgi:hypothetical protein
MDIKNGYNLYATANIIARMFELSQIICCSSGMADSTEMNPMTDEKNDTKTAHAYAWFMLYFDYCSLYTFSDQVRSDG